MAKGSSMREILGGGGQFLGALSDSLLPLKLFHIFSHSNSVHPALCCGNCCSQGSSKLPEAMEPMSESWE